MIDFNHLANTTKGDFQVFHANSKSNGSDWYTWRKPRGCNFVQFVGLSGGGGGGGALGGVNVNQNNAGGGGGTGGNFSILTYPLWAFPDILYISVGYGGAGGYGYGSGTLSSNGVAGVNTYISLEPKALQANLVGTTLLMAINGGGEGYAGSSYSGSTFVGGIGGIWNLGITSDIVQLSGLAHGSAGVRNQYATGDVTSNVYRQMGGGHTGNPGRDWPFQANFPLTSGGGGGGPGNTDGSNGGQGGRIIGSGAFPTIEYPNIQNNGSDGPSGCQPIPGLFYFYGGNGGDGAAWYGSTPYNGGNGGDGAYGCGGGGGGAGNQFAGAFGGRGGNGGNGLVIALSW